MTFTLVSVVYATAVSKPGHGVAAPLAVGFTLFASAFVGVSLRMLFTAHRTWTVIKPSVGCGTYCDSCITSIALLLWPRGRQTLAAAVARHVMPSSEVADRFSMT